MKKIIFCMALLSCLNISLFAQVVAGKFGQGLQITGQDSSYYLKLGFRFQSLFINQWDLIDDDLEGLDNYNSSLLIRRSRLKFDGWALTPKLEYKLELALSNRDNSGGASDEFRNAANIVLDAYVKWNFYKNLSIQFGQTKLPGNRERVISSGNLQFVDRSQLNSRFNLDRDAGFQFDNFHVLGAQFLVREKIAISQGDGRNVTDGYFGGYDFTFHLEALPFGEFLSNGDYVGSAIKRESSPKLAVAIAYDINENAVRERGQLGDFIQDETGEYFGRTLHTFFADLMFKYHGFSMMAEYAHRRTQNDVSNVFDENARVIGTYYTGEAMNIQAGYLCKNNWELAARFTNVMPDAGVAIREKEYTLGLSKFIVGHKLKIQTDLTYRSLAATDDEVVIRAQMDFHF